MVEDFYSSANTATPLSSTPVQFLIHTYNPPVGCSSLPTIIGPYPDQSCLDAKVGTPFNFILTAQTGCSGTTITDFVTISPIGMIKASTIIALSSTVYAISFNWIPASYQLGPHVFCGAAIDTYDIQSKQICFKFIVGSASSSNTCPPTTTAITTIATSTNSTDTGIRYKKTIHGLLYRQLIE